MNNKKNNITFIGNAIVDILWQTSDEFLNDLGPIELQERIEK